MKAVFDTNILVDFLRGVPQAKEEIARYSTPLISIVTWMEILVGASSAKEEELLKKFLGRFTLHGLGQEIAERAVSIRKDMRIKLPDAIIWATAKTESCLLVTRNVKDFDENSVDVRVPYVL